MKKPSRWQDDSFETHTIPLAVPEDFSVKWGERFFKGKPEASIEVVQVASGLSLRTAVLKTDGSRRVLEAFRATGFDLRMDEAIKEELPFQPGVVVFSDELKFELKKRADMTKKYWVRAGEIAAKQCGLEVERAMGRMLEPDINRLVFVDRRTLAALPPYMEAFPSGTNLTRSDLLKPECEESYKAPHAELKERLQKNGGYLPFVPSERKEQQWRICQELETAQRVIFVNERGVKVDFTPRWDIEAFPPERIRSSWTRDVWGKVTTPIRDGGNRQR